MHEIYGRVEVPADPLPRIILACFMLVSYPYPGVETANMTL